MPPWNALPLTTRPRSKWASFVARLRASTWPAVAGRVAGVVVALLVLGWIGRTAAAGPPSPSLSSVTAATATTADRAMPEVDAAAPPLPLPTIVPLDAGAPMVSHGRASATEPVYINHASVDELRRLPGVGPKRAEAILALRQRVGRFQRVEDLLRVKGIGRGAVKKWRPLVRLDAPTASATTIAADAGST
jgi:competence protein ComEA